MRRLAFVLLPSLFGCHGSQMLVDPGPAPQNGAQVILPIQKGLQPGTDSEMCTWTDFIPDHTVYVKAFQGFQTQGGHHVVTFKTTEHQPAGTTRKCTDQDMSTFRFVGTGSAGEGATEKQVIPGDLVYLINPGEQLVVNHHYINATPNVIDAQSVLDLWFIDPGVKFTPGGSLVAVDTDLHLAPGMPTKEIHCTMQNDAKVWSQIPHMHAFGVEITVDHTPAGGTAHRLFDVTPWSPDMTFHPPTQTFDPGAPEIFHKGDTLDVHCLWNNNTAGDLTFGMEMCVFFANTVDDQNLGNVACNGGLWTTF